MTEAFPIVGRLAPTVHAVMIDVDLVFLDIAHDAYACLPDVAAELQLSPDRRSLSMANASLAGDLRRGGLIHEGEGVNSAASRPLPARPTASALTHTFERARWADLPELTRATLDIAIAYRNRSLAELLESVSLPGRLELGSGDQAEMLAVVERFHRWVPFAPVSGKCLLRAFMLLRLLRRTGHDAQWVFGVATWPFRAHCWLQCGETVLDDTVDRLTPYHPILAV